MPGRKDCTDCARYPRQTRQALGSPTNTLEVGFHELFRDIQVVTLPKKSTDGEVAEVGAILVRVDGNPIKRPEIFVETNGDRRVKGVADARDDRISGSSTLIHKIIITQ